MIEASTRRMSSSFAFAAASHALVLGALALTKPAVMAARPRVPEEIIPIEAVEPPVERRVESPTAPAAVAPPLDPRTEVGAIAHRAARVAEPRAGAATGSEAGSGVAGDGSGESSGAGEPGGSGVANGWNDGRGLDGASASREALPPPLVPRAVPAPDAVFDVKSGAESKSVTTISSGITASVYGAAESKAPQHGHGTIKVEIGPDGEVSSVSSSSPSWSDAARAIAKSLAGRHLRLPEGAKSAVITYAVDADVSNPKNYLQGDPRVLVPCGTAGLDGVGRLDSQPNITCVAPPPHLRFDVSIKVLGERYSR